MEQTPAAAAVRMHLCNTRNKKYIIITVEQKKTELRAGIRKILHFHPPLLPRLIIIWPFWPCSLATAVDHRWTQRKPLAGRLNVNPVIIYAIKCWVLYILIHPSGDPRGGTGGGSSGRQSASSCYSWPESVGWVRERVFFRGKLKSANFHKAEAICKLMFAPGNAFNTSRLPAGGDGYCLQ